VSRRAESDQPSGAATAASRDGIAGAWSALAGWQRIAAVLSVLVMAFGLGLGAWNGLRPPAPTATVVGAGATAGSAGGIASGFAPLEPGDGTDADPAASGTPAGEDPWSPAIFRMGFSFFVGFAVAFALRAFVRVSLITLGLYFLTLFGLQYAGFIEVDWAAIGARYDGIRDWLGTELDSFASFATGYLPSAGTAMLGLATGFRRRG